MNYATIAVKPIPVLGSIMEMLDSIIENVYIHFYKKKLEGRVDIISKILTSKFDNENQMLIEISKIVLVHIELKMDELLQKQEILVKKTAIEDAISLILCLYRNHKMIIESQETLSEQIRSVISNNNVESLSAENAPPNEDLTKIHENISGIVDLLGSSTLLPL